MAFHKHGSYEVLSVEMAPGGNRGLRRAMAKAGCTVEPGQKYTYKTAHRAEFQYVQRDGYLYVRSRAISSRVNDNYDGFSAPEIKKAYRTFVGKPVFVNHHNENHRRARGVVIDAALHEDVNPDGSPDTWVEVLMEVDAVKFPKLAKAILAGEIDRTSMGTDVKYSICSACGNRAETPLDYCVHIPRMKGQKIYRVTASGERVGEVIYEKCYGLSFFENSLLVEEPADPSAFFLGVEGIGVTASRSSALDTDGMETLMDAVRSEGAVEILYEQKPGQFNKRKGRVVGGNDSTIVLDDDPGRPIPWGSVSTVRAARKTAAMGKQFYCPHRDATGLSFNHDGGDGSPPRKKCRYCGGELQARTGMYGIFEWSRDGRYLVKDALAMFPTRVKADAYISQHSTDNWVVHWIPESAVIKTTSRVAAFGVGDNVDAWFEPFRNPQLDPEGIFYDWARGFEEDMTYGPGYDRGVNDYLTDARLFFRRGDLDAARAQLRNATDRQLHRLGSKTAAQVCPECGSTDLEHGPDLDRDGREWDFSSCNHCGLRIYDDGSHESRLVSNPTTILSSLAYNHHRTFSTASTWTIPATFNLNGGLKVVAYGEQIAPSEVDTLRDENCPVCGERDSFNGDECQVCMFIKPPDEFMDPDLSKAQQVDLRQEQSEDSTGVGGLKCDNCGATFDAAGGIGTTGLLRFMALSPPDRMQLTKSPDADDTAQGANEAVSTQFKAGDPCPDCGEGKLQPIAPSGDADAPILDAFEPPGTPDDSKDEETDTDKQDGKGDPDKSPDSDDDDDDEDDDKKPSFLKKKKDARRRPVRASHEEGTNVLMRTALQTMAEQQEISKANMLAISRIARLAGVDVSDLYREAEQKIASLNRHADADNPGQPVPSPAAEAPVATTPEQTQGLDANDVMTPGSTTETDVSPDAVTNVQGTGEVIGAPLDLNQQDVTAPVAGTEGPLPLADVKTEADVRIGDPNNRETMMPLVGPFANQPTTGSRQVDNRTIAALNLARLRVQANIASGDDLVITTDIVRSAMTDEAIQGEINTLSKVVASAPQNPVTARRVISGTPPGAMRTIASLQPSAGEVFSPVSQPAQFDSNDTALFES